MVVKAIEEWYMVLALTGLENIKWWHRNISRKGFVVNGFINHYPDFIVMTEKGKIVLIETKGDHLDNDQNRKKLILSHKWREKAGEPFRYYMIFRRKHLSLMVRISLTGFRRCWGNCDIHFQRAIAEMLPPHFTIHKKIQPIG